MGWLKVTIDFVLHVTQLDGFAPLVGLSDVQKPLRPDVPSVIIDPSPPATEGCYGTACPTYAPITCSYPELEKEGWEFCNTEESRNCWIRDPGESQPAFTQWDVKTNYERETPPGITREYWLELTHNDELTPDGVDKIMGKYFNGTYPGPTLQACWGDQLVVHVTNKRTDNGTTIHWHGIRQLFSNEMDGVNGVTQCPISYGDTFTVNNFTAQQYGTTWYHSHYSQQYPDGVAAPLVIHGPTSENWDIDVYYTNLKQLGPVLISDWVHETAFIVYAVEMAGGAPPADSILVNGQGHYNSSGNITGSYFETHFTRNKTHILRLINGSAGSSFVFSIDEHTMTIISNDLVAIEPIHDVSSLFIGIGQRYTVVVQAKDQDEGDYWMRTTPATNCGGFSNPPDQRTGIIRYNASSTALPQVDTPQNNTACDDVSIDLLNPIVPWCVDQHPQNNVTEDTYEAGIQGEPDASLGPPGHPYAHWFLGDRPMWLNFSMPTILYVDESINNPNYTVTEEDYNIGFIYLIIHGQTQPFTADHPIHLHGSDFVILAQSRDPWDEQTSPSQFRYDNPPRRDTAMLPAGGFLAVAFKPDNPGSWLLHCHIAWHASSGLALQILVRPYDIPDFLGDLAETERVCDNWSRSPLALSMPQIQDDSGV